MTPALSASSLPVNHEVTEALKPCPFCGGEANGGGHARYSRPLPDTHWADGSDITECFFVNCIKCGIDNGRSGLVGGYQTKAEAIEAWNRRSAAVPVSGEEQVERVREFVARHTSTFEGQVVACSSPSLEDWRAFVAALREAAPVVSDEGR